MGAQFTPAPPAAITRALARFDRGQLAGFIAVAIDLLDLADGDPDEEDDGTAEYAGDERDTAWTEWAGRARRRKVTSAGYEAPPRKNDWFGTGTIEDAEEDDPGGEDQL